MGPLSYVPNVDSIQLTDSQAFLFLGGYVQNASNPTYVYNFTSVPLEFGQPPAVAIQDLGILMSPDLLKRSIINAIYYINNIPPSTLSSLLGSSGVSLSKLQISLPDYDRINIYAQN